MLKVHMFLIVQQVDLHGQVVYFTEFRILRCGCPPVICKGDQNGPGATQLTRIPFAPSSSDKLFVNEIMAAFEAA